MAVEPVTELGSGGALRLPCAWVMSLSAPPASYTAAVERYLTDRKAPAGTPTLDVCPETGRARLSCRRTEEIFEEDTRLPANPLASPEDIEDLDGWTLHRLRQSALAHDAENGASTPMPPARSRHTSVRSLERYARPGVDAVARHVAERDPAARRKG